MTASEFWESVIVGPDLWGHAYVYITRLGGRVVSLDILDPSITVVKRNRDGDISYKVGEDIFWC